MREHQTARIDIESKIDDLVSMSEVCIIVMEQLQVEERAYANMPDMSAERAAKHLACWRQAHDFAVRHLVGMAAELGRAYEAEREAA